MTLNLNINIFDYIDKLKDNDVLVKFWIFLFKR